MAVNVRAESYAVPVAAAVLALAYLAVSLLAPALLAPVAVAAVVAGCSVVLTTRRSPLLVLSVAAIGLWLTSAFAAAWLLDARPGGGLLLIVAALFVVPLPLIPWLYASTFSAGHGPRATGHGEGP